MFNFFRSLLKLHNCYVWNIDQSWSFSPPQKLWMDRTSLLNNKNITSLSMMPNCIGSHTSKFGLLLKQSYRITSKDIEYSTWATFTTFLWCFGSLELDNPNPSNFYYSKARILFKTSPSKGKKYCSFVRMRKLWQNCGWTVALIILAHTQNIQQLWAFRLFRWFLLHCLFKGRKFQSLIFQN